MLKIVPSLCTECQICMEICSLAHFGENAPKRSRIWIEAEWPKEPHIFVCLACEDHDCVQACPAGALQWEDWIRLDRNLCDACGVCVESCPVGGIRIDPTEHTPLICDTCQDEFRCVRWCPAKAIERSG
ncbi:MAG: 4Fe-4S binding protein [Syntrophobacterales bacterium]|nr:MAG: 4Fe-4S binding protein [Syntrophobacterales bacterium]